jgi:hypothetical protein
MEISPSEAAVIYARACRAWYGRRAAKVIAGQIRRLKHRGDSGGVAAWSKVADQLSELDAVHKPRHRAARGKLY